MENRKEDQKKDREENKEKGSYLEYSEKYEFPEYLEYIKVHAASFFFDLVRNHPYRRIYYEELFLKYSFYDHIPVEHLLQEAGDDVELRALILRRQYTRQSTDDPLKHLEI